MKVEQPELNLKEQKPLTTFNCDEVRTSFDTLLKGLDGKTVTKDDVLFLRVKNLNQLECMSDNYNSCKASYEGCRTKINGLKERFQKD
jgi:hypothetical protein